MPEDIQQLVIARPETMTAAREVARLLSEEACRPLIEEPVQDGLSLKATHAIVDAALTNPDQAPRLVAAQITERHAMASRRSTVRTWDARFDELTAAQRVELQRRIDEWLIVLERLTEQLRSQICLCAKICDIL